MNQPIVFLVNRTDAIDPSSTTSALISEALASGREVVVADVLHLRVAAGQRVWVDGQQIDPDRHVSVPVPEVLNQRAARVRLELKDAAAVVVRTSPGRDEAYAWAHRFALQALALARAAGVRVVNDPIGLAKASSKLYSAGLPPEFTPRTLITRSFDATYNFVRGLGEAAVIKPLIGSGGRDIFFVDGHESENLEQICTLLGRSGYFVVQEYLPDVEDGDFRVLLLDGKVLELGGEQAVIHRVPKLGQFRSNVSMGATAKPGFLADGQAEVANQVAQQVFADGIRLAGLDMVGECILEVNVFSTGGLNDADRFFRRNFTRHVLDVLLGSD